MRIAPAISWRELGRRSRTIGAWLTIIGGAVLLLQTLLNGWIPVPKGYQTTTAVVEARERVGTFQNPAFLVTLAYDVPQNGDSVEPFRSGRRVDYELYRTLSAGEEVTIQYNLNNPFEWQIARMPTSPRLEDFGLGVLMILIGGFSLVFPFIIRLASREEDFVYSEKARVR